jgi:aminopeptidase N
VAISYAKPMSSYLLMLAIGKFDKYTEKTKCGTELELYLEHKDAARFEPAYRYSVRMFDFLKRK